MRLSSSDYFLCQGPHTVVLRSAQEPAERIALDAAMVHPWVLQGTRPALKPAPETVSARPLLTAVQVLR